MPIELALDGFVGEPGNTAADLRAALRSGGEVTLHINSVGGIATEGAAMHAILKAHAGRVDVIVEGIAASAASLIAMAGDSITFRPAALMMIHDPAGVTIGPAASHDKTADVLRTMSGEYAKIYAARTGLPVKRVREMMAEETWLTAEQARELGFADTAADGATAAAPIFNYSLFRNAPASLLATNRQDKTMPLATQPAAPAATPPVTPSAPPVDITADILTRCSAAKMSAAQAAQIVSAAAGDMNKAVEAIMAHLVAEKEQDPYRPSVTVGQDAGGDPAGHTAALGDAIFAKLKGRSPEGAGKSFAGMTTAGLAAEWLRARGLRPVSNVASDIVKQAMSTRQPFMAGAGFHSTSDFPIVLGDQLHKSLQTLFAAADSGVSRIVGTGTMADFREKKIGKLSSFPSLKPVGEGGELTWGTIDEDGQSISVAAFGRALSISWQSLVNDNLGAVERSIRDISFAAVNLKAGLILTALLTATMRDGKTLFHADHDNSLDAGPPSVEALTQMRTAMRLQKSMGPEAEQQVLGLAPKVLLVPAALETDAEKLVASITPNTVDAANPFASLIVATEPRLDAIDPATWFTFADPALMPAVEFDTLEGMAMPRLEIQDPADFSRLGTSFRVYWACGAAPVEHRSGVKNSGTSDSE